MMELSKFTWCHLEIKSKNDMHCGNSQEIFAEFSSVEFEKFLSQDSKKTIIYFSVNVFLLQLTFDYNFEYCKNIDSKIYRYY